MNKKEKFQNITLTWKSKSTNREVKDEQTSIFKEIIEFNMWHGLYWSDKYMVYDDKNSKNDVLCMLS